MDKSVELLKVQIFHETSLQVTISSVFNALMVFLAVISIIVAFPFEGLYPLMASICRTICVLVIIPVSAFYLTRRIKSVLHDYKQKLKIASEMIEEIKQGKEVPTLKDLIEGRYPKDQRQNTRERRTTKDAGK